MNVASDTSFRHDDNCGESQTIRTGTPFGLRIRTAALGVAVGAAMLGACTTTPPPAPPPPPPPPPPPVEVIPYRPLPPGGAAYVMQVPPKGPDGRRITINSNLTEDQLVWNFRSAWNVAALNCLAPQYEPILQGYSAFIKDHARSLKRVNDRIEKTYTSRFRARRDAMVERDGLTTSVYNFFALPPARTGFCLTVLDMSNRALAQPPSDPMAFAAANFDNLLVPFDTFFGEYETYQQLSAQWDARYGALYGASQPGWVAVQQARASGAAVPEITSIDPSATLAGSSTTQQSVIDPETGLAVPIVPVEEGVISQPVVEPIKTEPDDK